MRVQPAALLTVAILLATALDEIILLGAAPRLFGARPAPTAPAPKHDAVRDAETAERHACLVLRPFDLYDPRTSCEAR